MDFKFSPKIADRMLAVGKEEGLGASEIALHAAAILATVTPSQKIALDVIEYVYMAMSDVVMDAVVKALNESLAEHAKEEEAKAKEEADDATVH